MHFVENQNKEAHQKLAPLTMQNFPELCGEKGKCGQNVEELPSLEESKKELSSHDDISPDRPSHDRATACSLNPCIDVAELKNDIEDPIHCSKTPVNAGEISEHELETPVTRVANNELSDDDCTEIGEDINCHKREGNDEQESILSKPHKMLKFTVTAKTEFLLSVHCVKRNVTWRRTSQRMTEMEWI